MLHAEQNSAIVPVIHWLCTIAKCKELQPRCKYYSRGNAGLCRHLGNWIDGLQECKSIPAQEGRMKAIAGNEAVS